MNHCCCFPSSLLSPAGLLHPFFSTILVALVVATNRSILLHSIFPPYIHPHPVCVPFFSADTDKAVITIIRISGPNSPGTVRILCFPLLTIAHSIQNRFFAYLVAGRLVNKSAG